MALMPGNCSALCMLALNNDFTSLKKLQAAVGNPPAHTAGSDVTVFGAEMDEQWAMVPG